jgi:hypothetical protein
VNANDWIQMAGHPLAGRNGRPINPRALPYLATKAPAKLSGSFARAARQTLLRAARLTGEIDMLLPVVAAQRRRTVRDTTLYEQSRPGNAGLAAQMRHMAAVQRARR